MSIAQLDRWAGSVLEVLWRSSWQAAALALLVLAAQWILKQRLSARWRHNLWLLVLLRLIVPVTPQSPWSVFNFAPRVHSPFATVAVDEVPLEPPLAVSHGSVATNAAKPQVTTAPLVRWKLILASIWIGGVALLLARILLATAKLIASMRRMRTIDDEAVTALCDRCREELRITREVRLLVCDELAAPALMGVLRPKLLLPRNVMESFHPAELRLILLHELAHLKRHDVAINWLVALLQAIHWFNPVIWLAFARLRSDRELACDEMVLLAAGDADHAKYGHTIVKLLQSLPKLPQSHASVAPSQAAAVGILERAHPMRRRITMIAQFPRRAKQWTILAALCMLALAGFGLTDAVRGEDSPHATAAASKSLPLASPTTQTIVEADIFVADPTLASPTTQADVVAVPMAIDPTTVATDTSPRPADAVSDAEQTYRQLQRRVPEVRFDAIGMAEVIDFLRDVTGMNIVVNWRALEAAGVEKDAPIDLRLKNATLVQVLRQMGKVVGGEAVQLGFAIDGGSIVFTTAEDASHQTRIRSYDISDLAGAATTQPGAEGTIAALETIKSAIMDNVSPDAWREQGGTVAGISIVGNKFLVRAPDMMHLEVDELLAELRRN